MKHFSLEKKENVFILTMINGEKDNTFDLDYWSEYNTLLDEVENSEGNASLLLTSSHPKTFTTGINLDWLFGASPTDFEAFVKTFDNTLLRLALLNLPTIACITGNCYAGGAIMSCCYDFRFMREDRGRFCFPEVNIKIPFTDVMNDIIDLIPNKHILNDLALTGRAIGGIECKETHVVNQIFPENKLFEQTLAFAKTMAEKDRGTYTKIKQGLKPKILNRKQA